MANGWQLTPLSEALIERKESPSLESIEMEEIRIVGKIGFKEGQIELREGKKTKTKMILIRPGDLVISGINAVKGAIAIYPETKIDPIAATIHYSSYSVNQERAHIKFLWWFLRSTIFREIVQEHIPGGIKTELKGKRFLKVPIPLPSLDEQRRILARIETLAGRIAEVQSLHEEISQESEALLRAIIHDDGDVSPTPMNELVTQQTPDVIVSPDEYYQFAGVYSFGRGVFKGLRKKGDEFKYPKLSRLKTGNFTYPKLMAWEGAYGIVPPECNDFVVSTEFPVFELNQDKILPETMAVYFGNPAIWGELSGQSTGTNVRRRRLNPKTFLVYEFPLPSMEKQLLLQKVYQRVDELRRLQSESQRELVSLLPSVLDQAFNGKL